MQQKPHMDHEELLSQVNQRFDRLEAKIDKYAENTVQNTQDINWIRGTIKLGGSALVALLGATAAWFLNLLK